MIANPVNPANRVNPVNNPPRYYRDVARRVSTNLRMIANSVNPANRVNPVKKSA
jgi:hypothetical protein